MSSPTDGRTQYFWTCARPGRTGDPRTKDAEIADETVHRWVLGLGKLGPNIAIVSLLGGKPGGRSEFSFYSFCGGSDRSGDNPGRLPFQDWLDRWHGDMSIWLRQHPTVDFERMAPEDLDAVASDINELLSAGRTVVVMDSGGATRTGMVCTHMHAIEDARVSGGAELRALSKEAKQVVHSARIPSRSVEARFRKEKRRGQRGPGAPPYEGGLPGLGKHR